MITLPELLRGVDYRTLSSEQRENVDTLLARINVIRTAWAKPMTVTSGFRSKNDHLRIYKEIAVKRGVVFDASKIPWRSAHLMAAAVDIADPDGKLYDWCVANEALLVKTGLWCEVKDDQPRVHFQIWAPASGKRFFHP